VTTAVLFAAGGYLIGTVSFARLVGRWRRPSADITVTELPIGDTDETWTYRGVSATSVIHGVGAGWGLTVIALDAAKAFVPTLAVRLAFPDESLHLLVALAVVAGHVWPVWYRFRGGRGQACALGVMFAVDPLGIPVVMIAGAIVGVLVVTSVYFARNSSILYLIPWFWLRDGIGAEFWFAVALNVIYWIALIPDVREELRVAGMLGTFRRPYPARLREAIRRFFSTED
jgi:glycerol-3-phosphate acyltransferase PlsY